MDTKTPFLSIIVPAYNVEPYIKQCVDSILEQNFEDYELLLVDDGSTDHTGQICDAYAVKDGRVRVIHKQNGGLVSARKAGIREARGKYVGYADGDDWIAPDMYEKLCNSAKKENADIVICDLIASYGDKEEVITHKMQGGVYAGEQLEKEIYPHMLCRGEYFSFGFQPSLCCKIFRTEVLKNNQLSVNDRIKLGEDAACFYITMLDAEKVVYLKGTAGYYYRMRDSSISHSMIKSFYTDEIFILLEYMGKELHKREQYAEMMLEQLYMYTCYMLDNMIMPHITFSEVFLRKNFSKEIAVIAEYPMCAAVMEFFRNHRASSRAKRIWKVIEKNSLGRKLELYLFVIYEKLHKRKNSAI